MKLVLTGQHSLCGATGRQLSKNQVYGKSTLHTHFSTILPTSKLTLQLLMFLFADASTSLYSAIANFLLNGPYSQFQTKPMFTSTLV